jgi:RAP1 GTPase activating protein 1
MVKSINLVSGSPSYERFLTALGKKRELLGWKGFAGGLDTTHGKTGKHFLHSKWKEFEVMFHCSTLLPFREGDPQQIERKRHIGNGKISLS